MLIGDLKVNIIAAVGIAISILRVDLIGEVARFKLPLPLNDRLTASARPRGVSEEHRARWVTCLVEPEGRSG